MRFALYFLRSSPQVPKVIWQEAPISRCRYSAAWNHSIRRYVSNTELQPGNPVADEDQTQGDNSEGKVLNTKNLRLVECPDNSKYMKIAIIGLPNAGKSTIINALTKYDVCPVSKRPHTTRNNQQAVFLDQETQLVFIDTPGVVNVKEIKKFGFTDEFVFGPEKSIGRAHLIAVMHDVSNSASREKLDFRIKSVLKKFPDKKSVLILNKIDKIQRKDTLLDTMKYLTCGYVGGKPLPVTTFEEKKKQSHLRMNTEEILSKAKKRHEELHSSPENQQLLIAKKFFTDNEIEKGIHEQGWPQFNDVFMVSALEEDGIDLLRRYLILNAEPEPWLFDSETLTNVPPMKLALKLIKAKLLEHLPQEIPFKVKPVIELWDVNESGTLCISIKLKCPKERYKWRIVGTGGTLINKITLDTQAALSSVMSQPVKLTLNPELDPGLASLEK